MAKANKPQAQAKAREHYGKAAKAEEDGDDMRAKVNELLGDYQVDRARGKYDIAE
jgi:hypothetical protein